MTDHATTTYGLTPVQEQVIVAITGGATMKAAAAAASIHRNTIAYWRRTSAAFRDALAHAHFDKAIFIRYEAETRVAIAFAAIHAILTSPTASDSVRLKAALYVIDKALTPPPPAPDAMQQVQAGPEKPGIVHRNAQIGFQSQNPVTAEPQNHEIVHRNAQSTPPQPIRSDSKVSPNEPCPCGSPPEVPTMPPRQPAQSNGRIGVR